MLEQTPQCIRILRTASICPNIYAAYINHDDDDDDDDDNETYTMVDVRCTLNITASDGLVICKYNFISCSNRSTASVV
jgi:hypothetical protein